MGGAIAPQAHTRRPRRQTCREDLGDHSEDSAASSSDECPFALPSSMPIGAVSSPCISVVFLFRATKKIPEQLYSSNSCPSLAEEGDAAFANWRKGLAPVFARCADRRSAMFQCTAEMSINVLRVRSSKK